MIIGKAISPFALRKKNGGGGGTDADAQAFITASGISGTNATATNKLVIDLKSANIWTKMKCIYPFVGNTSASQKYNLKDPRDLNAAFRLLFTGGFTFSSTGCKPNGTNAWANTFLLPSTSLSDGSCHVSIYNRTGVSGTANDWGTSGGSGALATAISLGGNAYLDCYNSSGNRLVAANADPKGFYIANRSSTTSLKIFKNNAQLGTTSTVVSTGVAVLVNPLVFFSYNPPSNYSNRECAFASIGDGLTDAEALAFYNAVQTFQTTLGRQV